LDGRDAADKLAVLAADLGAVVGEARRETISQEVIDAGPKGSETVVRQVARLELGARPAASVSVRRLERSHPLALLREEQNGVIIECAGGERSVLIGRGAGRWPTAESVLADVLDVRRVEKKGAER
jgi:homoserine dehydrogenase